MEQAAMAACEASARGNYTAEPRGRALCELSGLGSLLAWEPAGGLRFGPIQIDRLGSRLVA